MQLGEPGAQAGAEGALSNPRRTTGKLLSKHLTEFVKRSPWLVFRAMFGILAEWPVMTANPQDHRVTASRVPWQVSVACVRAKPGGVPPRLTTALARAAAWR